LRWLQPVRPGDELRLRVTVTEARRSRSKPQQGIVCSVVEVLNQQGEVVMTLKRPASSAADGRTNPLRTA